MAAARHLPEVLVTITINSTGPTQPDVKIGTSDTIAFHNLAPYAVKITFTTSNGTVFNDIPSISGSGHTSASQGPQRINQTVNYSITNLSSGAVQGPYGIQVGIGPLRINIASANPTPLSMETVSIPQGGQIQFNCDQAYPTYTWTITGVFSPDLTGPGLIQGMNPVQTAQVGNPANSDAYNLNSLNNVQGGGTVHINS